MVSNVKVYGLENSIRVAKFPMTTKSQSTTEELTQGIANLAMTPCGEGHDNWLCGIVVQFDLTLTIKAWTEAERYHFFDIVSSQSTMHRIAKFDLRSQYNEYVDERMISIMEELRNKYNKTHDSEDYLRLLYSNPTGLKLTAGMTTNYRQLKTIYKQRKSHRLPEWREFCNWIKTLPHHELITGEQE